MPVILNGGRDTVLHGGGSPPGSSLRYEEPPSLPVKGPQRGVCRDREPGQRQGLRRLLSAWGRSGKVLRGELAGREGPSSGSRGPSQPGETPLAHSPQLALLFSCQMKSEWRTETVCPVRQATFRTPPPPGPAASPTQGECAPTPHPCPPRSPSC